MIGSKEKEKSQQFWAGSEKSGFARPQSLSLDLKPLTLTMSFLRVVNKLPKLIPTTRNYATSSTPKSFFSKFRSGALSGVLVFSTGAFLVYSHDSTAGIHR